LKLGEFELNFELNNAELLEIKREQFARNWGPGRDQTGSRPLFETELAALLELATRTGREEIEPAIKPGPGG
jgi:hypothetical protein